VRERILRKKRTGEERTKEGGNKKGNVKDKIKRKWMEKRK
jgi:hypothetical protein